MLFYAAVTVPHQLHGGGGGSDGGRGGGGGPLVELSDTEASDWTMPPKLTPHSPAVVVEGGVGSDGGDGDGTLVRVGTLGGGGADPSSSSTSPGQQQQQQQLAGGQVYSSATVYAVRNGNGAFAKFYYKFHNVKLTRKALYFYMPPGMPRPAEHWVDFISGNATHPGLPTMIVIKGEVQRQKWYYLPVRYTTTASKCGSAWVSKPTYFLQVRYRCGAARRGAVRYMCCAVHRVPGGGTKASTFTQYGGSRSACVPSAVLLLLLRRRWCQGLAALHRCHRAPPCPPPPSAATTFGTRGTRG